jgi:hypothetical protein
MSHRILIAGGYGVIGSAIALRLREEHPDVEIVLAGRRPEAGDALARRLGLARTRRLDVSERAVDLGDADLVVAALYDPANRLAAAALERGIAFVGITAKADDAAALAGIALHRPPRRPMVLAGHAAAGAATLIAAAVAARFARIESIAAAAVFDPADPVGPMTMGDGDSLVARALVRERGHWRWIEGLAHPRRIRIGGAEADAYPSSLLDAPSLAAVTGADDVRFDIAPVPSLGTRGGGPASSDLQVAMTGTLGDGRRVTVETVACDPRGIAHFTALGVLVAAERALGLDGAPAATGGLYLPETLAAPEAAVARFERLGVRIFTGEGTARRPVAEVSA